jgi:acetyl-CoA/propionyl-CoA carboxylase biotin carboxyl carrier protein
VKDPVLVANRGEIAVRVARTVHALGLRSATVFTDVDAASPHVDACDVAVRVPSYLDVDAIVEAARTAGARSVHPGYGFLSENPAFARAVTEAGLTWVGPPPEAIELMGDKARAKVLAREAGVPVVPGVEGDDVGVDEVRPLAAEHGFPVVVKAVAGGGGKGMRVVRSEDELEAAVDAARREAKAAFGDDRVLAERFLDRPRHIEVQVLADAHGNVVHLGERECSLQRRHQKVVEEAPSPVVDTPLRERIGDAAVALARACGYVGAGTVEFIATADAREVFFLEMNTRLQVEHPVTELVYGVDLVEHQLRIAGGEPLTLRQDDLRPQGHAVEARLYAEDPANGFLPATGTLRRWREPRGEGIRVDAGVREGSEVSTSYDPMLAKVIAHGPDRITALRRLDRALADLEVLGVATNAAFTRELLRRDDVRAGEQDTGLLERVLDELTHEPPADLLPAGAIAAYLHDTHHLTTTPGPWRRELEDHGEVRVDTTTVTAGDRRWTYHLTPGPGPSPKKGPGPSPNKGPGPSPKCSEFGTGPGPGGRVRVTIDGVSRSYVTWVSDEVVYVARDGHHLEARTLRKDRGRAAAPAGSLEAPMPGTVLLVHVENGQRVDEGDVLMVIESMKMELAITAPTAGTVEGLELRPGDRVSQRQPLVAVTAEEDDA